MKKKIKEWIREYKTAPIGKRIGVCGYITMEMIESINERVNGRNRTPEAVRLAVQDVARVGALIASHNVAFLIDDHGEPWGLHPDWMRQIIVQTIGKGGDWREDKIRQFLTSLEWDYETFMAPDYGENTMLYDVVWDDNGEHKDIQMLLKSIGTIPQGSVWMSSTGLLWKVTSVEGDRVYVERWDVKKEKWVADWFGRKVVQSWRRVKQYE